MATSEAAGKISEQVTASMETCESELAHVTVSLPGAPESTPIQHSTAATIEHVGADPPPED